MLAAVCERKNIFAETLDTGPESAHTHPIESAIVPTDLKEIAMKLIIPTTFKHQTVTQRAIVGSIKPADRAAIVAAFGDEAEAVLAEVQLVVDTAFAYVCGGSRVGSALIDQDGRKVTVRRVVEATPREEIEVADVAAAVALLKARIAESSDHVHMREGGKRMRMRADGQVITCGTARPFSDEQIASSVPVIAEFATQRGGVLGRLVVR